MADQQTRSAVAGATGWVMFWSVVMFACGVLAIYQPFAASIGTAIFLGWLILFIGIAHLLFAFQSQTVGGFIWKVLLGLLYGVAGIYVVANPVSGVVSLTLLLAVLLILEGVTETVLYFAVRPLLGSGWLLLDGLVSILLGMLVWAQWPGSSAWLLGTLVGINFIFAGLSRFMLALAVRQATNAVA